MFSVKTVLTCLTLVLFVGCSNPFQKFYHDYTDAMAEGVKRKILPSVVEPRIVKISWEDARDAARRMTEKSFVCVGESSFREITATQEQLLRQARTVNAELVLFSWSFAYTEGEVRHPTVPEPIKRIANTGVGAFDLEIDGAHVSDTLSQHPDTTALLPVRSELLPTDEPLYRVRATYWKRYKPRIIGIHVVALPDSIKEQIGRNAGAVVDLIIQDSPAFAANILRGDVIIAIAGKEISGPYDFVETIQQIAGQKVSIEILRGTKRLDVDVQLNADF